MAKRANGEGSIHKRKDGRWCASLSLERGKRKHFLGKTRTEVAHQLAAAIDGKEKGAVIATPRQTVRQFFTAWLDSVKPSLRPRTHVRYEELVRLHVNPEKVASHWSVWRRNTSNGCTRASSTKACRRRRSTTCTS